MANPKQGILKYFKPSGVIGAGKRPVSLSPEKPSTASEKSASSQSGANQTKKMRPEEREQPLTMVKTFEAIRSELPLIHSTISQSWFPVLLKEFQKPYFKKLNEFVEMERRNQKVYPPAEHVWSWTQLPIQDVKVVILGQDPYHGPGQANGLCFSVCPGIAIPPSLVNVFSELCSDIKGFSRPPHGSLTGWSKQGVLLLNATLTVRAASPKSHAGQGWEIFTDSVIKEVSAQCKGVVFLLWGSDAKSKASLVDKKKHHILTSVHPSPLSAYRGFMGCGHFSKCNELLTVQGKKPVDWSYLPEK